MKNVFFCLLILWGACTSYKVKHITLEYDAFCAIHAETGEDYYKVMPMHEENGHIIIYDDSICFIGQSDSMRYTLHSIGFNGDNRMARVLCKNSNNEDVLFLLSSVPFSTHYEACTLFKNGGIYFNIIRSY